MRAKEIERNEKGKFDKKENNHKKQIISPMCEHEIHGINFFRKASKKKTQKAIYSEWSMIYTPIHVLVNVR